MKKKDQNKGNDRDRENRMEAFMSLPPAIRNTLTKEEQEIFLNSEVWPESLCEKLSEFLFKIK